MKSQKHTKNLYKKADNLCLNNPFSFFFLVKIVLNGEAYTLSLFDTAGQVRIQEKLIILWYIQYSVC